MKKTEHFSAELALIQNEELRRIVTTYLENVPEYFWKIGASSSGKYHPAFSQGEGGLVRHTKAVVKFAVELLKMSSFGYMRDEYKDYVIAACIVHDTAKYGIEDEMDKSEYKNHSSNAADRFNEYCYECYGFEAPEFLLNAIRCHMGQWSAPEDRPFTQIDRCVHLADYIASRAFIDIPEITIDWNTVEEVEEDLPF